jgi:RNA polymerase sigma-70 factor, ECF subfamily
MFTTMRNLWIDRLRSPQERPEAFPPDENTVCAPLSMESLLVNKIAVRQAFELLSADHRDVLALVDIGGFSYDEAARMLGVPRGTVMSRVSRARRALAAELNENTIAAMPVASRKAKNE